MTPSDKNTIIETVCLSDFEAIARERISHLAYEYVSGGASDEVTVRWNQEAFEKIRLRPRILVDVSAIDTHINLFGEELPFPILLAPTAYHRLIHQDGEIATVRGASQAGAVLVVSTMATTSIEDIAQEATKPLWFQLYVQPDKDFTRDLVQRVQEKVLCFIFLAH